MACRGRYYNVKRSTVSGGPYSIIAPAISGTNYTDSNLVRCQNYYYVVTLTNDGYESLPSAEAGAEIPGALPPQFTNTDVGLVGFPGSASYCNGQLNISGSGSDIWGTNDAFQFVYTYLPVSTNCDIRAQVLAIQNTSANAKVAVMIRESLAANSSHALTDVEPSAGIEFIWRNGTGASASSDVVAGAPPAWVRLTRTNNTFTAWYSADGNSWTVIGTSTINMPVGAYVGLAVCAHNNSALTTALIDKVSASFLPTNAAPVLNSISNQTVNVGQTVAFTASVTDTSTPPLTLTFTLLNGPSDATLTQTDATNVVFNWRPMAANADAAYPVGLAVADNGFPSQSATQNFSILVNPLTMPVMAAMGIYNGRFMLQVNGESGPDYAVEVSTDLFDWSTLLITNSPAMPWTWMDTNPATLPSEFYRIKAGPPLP